MPKRNMIRTFVLSFGLTLTLTFDAPIWAQLPNLVDAEDLKIELSHPADRAWWDSRLQRAIENGYRPDSFHSEDRPLPKISAEVISVDYAWHTEGHPSVDSLKSRNCTSVIRYLSYDDKGKGGKNIQPDEWALLLNGGIAITLIWEWFAEDCLGGAAKGKEQGSAAVEQARMLGYPLGCAIYGACDFDIKSTQWNTSARAYFQAFANTVRAAGYRPGIYGPTDAIEWAWEDGSIDFGWQATASWAWSGGRNKTLNPHANLSQDRLGWSIDGQSCDKNSIKAEFYGQALPQQWPPMVAIRFSNLNFRKSQGLALHPLTNLKGQIRFGTQETISLHRF